MTRKPFARRGTTLRTVTRRTSLVFFFFLFFLCVFSPSEKGRKNTPKKKKKKINETSPPCHCPQGSPTPRKRLPRHTLRPFPTSRPSVVSPPRYAPHGSRYRPTCEVFVNLKKALPHPFQRVAVVLFVLIKDILHQLVYRTGIRPPHPWLERCKEPSN